MTPWRPRSTTRTPTQTQRSFSCRKRRATTAAHASCRSSGRSTTKRTARATASWSVQDLVESEYAGLVSAGTRKNALEKARPSSPRRTRTQPLEAEHHSTQAWDPLPPAIYRAHHEGHPRSLRGVRLDTRIWKARPSSLLRLDGTNSHGARWYPPQGQEGARRLQAD